MELIVALALYSGGVTGSYTHGDRVITFITGFESKRVCEVARRELRSLKETGFMYSSSKCIVLPKNMKAVEEARGVSGQKFSEYLKEADTQESN